MKKFFQLGIFFVVLIILSYNCYAQEAGSLDLLNNAKAHDGKRVVYKGEVIGDIMARGDHVWLHVNDGTIAIGIWIPKNLIQNISYAGDYQIKGDIVEVVGAFHRSCLEHGGDLDIHAQTINIVSPGAIVTSPVNKKKIYLGVSSFIIVLLFYALRKFFQSRK
jgi:hypothetical protein